MQSLPVLKSSSDPSVQQLVRLFHQSELEWARHLGDETELDYGRWINNPAMPLSDQANCLLDAFVYPGLTPGEVINGSTWLRCTLNPSMPVEQTQLLVDALTGNGWTTRSTDIWYRARSITSRPAPAKDLTIIPARASYRHYRQLMEQRSGIDPEISMLHLDDSHFDVLLALKSGEPVGCIGVLTIGEVGTIREWFVSTAHVSEEMDQVLLDRALEIAARGLLRYVMIGLTDTQTAAGELCQRAGFGIIGRVLSFYKNSCNLAEIVA